MRQKQHQVGISLIELLVGMAIGLLAILVITQLFLVSEEQRRTPTSGAHTHTNGILALTALQRDIRQAGYGINHRALLGCRLVESASSAALGLADGAAIHPIVIQAGQTATDSDRISVLSSNQVDVAFPIRIAAEHAANETEFVIATALPPQTNDWMLLASTGNTQCHAFQVADITNDGATTALQHGAAASIGQVPAGSLMVNMGAAPIHRRWSVSNQGQLQAADLARDAQAIDAFSDIVLLRALYAKDTTGDGSVNTYDTVQPITAAQWAQVLGIRIAIVARSPQSSRVPITDESLQWDLGGLGAPNSVACRANPNSQCLNLDVSAAGGDDWSNFRYRLFDTLVPVRNLLWNSTV